MATAGGPSGFAGILSAAASVSGALASLAGGITPVGVALEGLSGSLKLASDASAAFSRTIHEAGDIVRQFSNYSMGGLLAQIKLQIGDIKRNIDVSQQLSKGMLAFADATNKARDAWKSVGIEMDKSILELGRAFQRLSASLAPLVKPFVDIMTNARDSIAAFVDVVSTSVGGFRQYLDPIAKILGDIGGTLGKVIVDLTPSLASLGVTITRIIGSLEPIFASLGSGIGKVVDALIPVIEPLVGLLGKLWDVIGPFVPVIGSLIGTIGELINLFAQVVTGGGLLGEAVHVLGEAVGGTTPFFQTLADVLKAVIEWFNRLIRAIADAVKWLAEWVGIRQTEAQHLAKLVDLQREANIAAKAKDAPRNLEWMAQQRRLFMEGKLDPRAALDAGAINPFEAAMFGFMPGFAGAAGALAGRAAAGWGVMGARGMGAGPHRPRLRGRGDAAGAAAGGGPHPGDMPGAGGDAGRDDPEPLAGEIERGERILLGLKRTLERDLHPDVRKDIERRRDAVSRELHDLYRRAKRARLLHLIPPGIDVGFYVSPMDIRISTLADGPVWDWKRS